MMCLELINLPNNKDPYSILKYCKKTRSRRFTKVFHSLRCRIIKKFRLLEKVYNNVLKVGLVQKIYQTNT